MDLNGIRVPEASPLSWGLTGLVGQTQDRDYVSFWLVTPQSPLRRAGDGGCGEEDLAISA